MRDRRAPALAGAFLLLAALAVAASPEQRLAVSAADGTTLVSASALTLRYRHSVERTIVEEDFLPGPSGVRVVETRFESFWSGPAVAARMARPLRDAAGWAPRRA